MPRDVFRNKKHTSRHKKESDERRFLSDKGGEIYDSQVTGLADIPPKQGLRKSIFSVNYKFTNFLKYE